MKTRYILYPLLMLLAILLPTSCSFEEDIIDVPVSDSEKVHLTLDVSLAGASNADSRAFGYEDHNFTVLYLALFEQISDGNYYLKDFITANKVNGAFAVNLPKTANPCRLHFIANYPGLSMGFNEEGQLMGLLETLNQEGGHDVFWNYVSLNGIGVNNQTSLSLSVSLLRNYVQVKFDATNSTFTDLDNTTNDTGLTDVQYAIFNVPTKGTVAAYNPLLENKFADFVNENTNGYTLRSYDALTSDGYEGNEPYDDGTFLGNNNPETIQNTARYWNNLNAPFYMYERSNKQASASKKTCMIIRGKYNGASSYTYYKLDFVYNDATTQSKVYYNLLRNFIYTMRVTSVTGEGYSSVAEAISQPACNNISGDAVVADYTNISNGTSQLFVSSTYLLFTNENSVDLYFKYIPNVGSPTNTSNSSVTITREGDPILLLGTGGISAASAVTDGQYTGWSKVTLTPTELEGASVKNQYITISAGATFDEVTGDMIEAGLQRKIHLVMRQPYNLNTNWVSVTSKVSNTANSTVNVTMTIPSGIPEQLFPLRMFIYSAANTIYATGMPIEVRNGKYGFIYEISYDDYYDSDTNLYTTRFTVPFMTNCAASATTVYVENNYFDTTNNKNASSFTN